MEATQSPMQVAEELVNVQRQIKQLDKDLAKLNDRKKMLCARIEHAMEEGQFPLSSSVAGANVHHKSQIWAGPSEDHETLIAVLEEVGLTEYLPDKVNSQSISGYVRERINKAAEDLPDTASLEDKIAASDLDPRLVAALKITEKTSVVVNGA